MFTVYFESHYGLPVTTQSTSKVQTSFQLTLLTEPILLTFSRHFSLTK